MNQWRFLNTGFNDGATNMAIDEVLARRSVPQNKTPVFRVYQWNPYTISLGYNQDLRDLCVEKCEHDGIGIVKRPTGGRAVLHAEEMTYSVIIPNESEFFSEDILATYNRISLALLNGIRLYGVKAEFVKRSVENEKSSAYKNDVPCFSTSAKYEIAYENNKLVGSAQRRYQNSVLQHGSILTGDFHLKLAEYIATDKNGGRELFRKALEKKTTSISQILSTNVDEVRLIDALKKGFEKSFNIKLVKSQLTPQELKEVKKSLKTN